MALGACSWYYFKKIKEKEFFKKTVCKYFSFQTKTYPLTRITNANFGSGSMKKFPLLRAWRRKWMRERSWERYSLMYCSARLNASARRLLFFFFKEMRIFWRISRADCAVFLRFKTVSGAGVLLNKKNIRWRICFCRERKSRIAQLLPLSLSRWFVWTSWKYNCDFWKNHNNNFHVKTCVIHKNNNYFNQGVCLKHDDNILSSLFLSLFGFVRYQKKKNKNIEDSKQELGFVVFSFFSLKKKKTTDKKNHISKAKNKTKFFPFFTQKNGKKIVWIHK